MNLKKKTKSKKRMFARAAGVLLSAVLLMQGCIQPGTDGAQTSGTGSSQNTYLYQTTSYTYRTAVDESVLTTGMNTAYLLLANKTSPLGEHYIPGALVTLTCATNPANGGRSETLDSRAAAALYAMLEEMRADGVSDIFVTSSYRSYDRQSSLFYNYISQEMAKKPNLSRSEAEEIVLTYSARPGTSEHQTGLCIDFGTNSEYNTVGEVLTEAFENTAAFGWLTQNCYRFGFILRYPEDKVGVTGYSYEPWHYRFVGREAATEIMLRRLCMEEFLSEMP